MSDTTNLIAIELRYFGPIPDLAKNKIDPALDRLGTDFSGMLCSATFRHRPDAQADYAIDYWDQGFAALLKRLGGAEAVAEFVEPAQQFYRTLHFQRESIEPDEVEGDGPYSYTSDHATICLSGETVSQIAALGLAIHVTYRLKPPHRQ